MGGRFSAGLDRVGIALIGCGLIGRQHATSLKSIIDLKLSPLSLELVAAADKSVERAESFKSEFGFKTATSDFLAAIEDQAVNAVYIATPTNDHMEILKAAAERGKAIFCEKPLAHTGDEAQKMADLVKQNDVPAQVGLVLRYSPIFTELKSLLQGEAPSVGGLKPMGVIFRDDQCLPVEGYYKSTWRGDVAIAGGGTLIEHSIHDIDILRWLFGEPESLYARLSYFSQYRGIEDVAAVVFSFAGGLSVNLLSVWHQVPPRGSERRVEMFLDRACFNSIGDFEGTLDVQVEDRPTVSLSNADLQARFRQRFKIDAGLPAPAANSYLQESLHFVRALAEGSRPSPDLEEAVKAHRLVDAIYKSAKSGRPVELLAV